MGGEKLELMIAYNTKLKKHIHIVFNDGKEVFGSYDKYHLKMWLDLNGYRFNYPFKFDRFDCKGSYHNRISCVRTSLKR